MKGGAAGYHSRLCGPDQLRSVRELSQVVIFLRHPEALGAMRRASKDGRPGIGAESFEARSLRSLAPQDDGLRRRFTEGRASVPSAVEWTAISSYVLKIVDFCRARGFSLQGQ